LRVCVDSVRASGVSGSMRVKQVVARIVATKPTKPPELRAHEALRVSLFREPWSWLGLTAIRWRKAPFDERIWLF